MLKLNTSEDGAALPESAWPPAGRADTLLSIFKPQELVELLVDERESFDSKELTYLVFELARRSGHYYSEPDILSFIGKLQFLFDSEESGIKAYVKEHAGELLSFIVSSIPPSDTSWVVKGFFVHLLSEAVVFPVEEYKMAAKKMPSESDNAIILLLGAAGQAVQRIEAEREMEEAEEFCDLAENIFTSRYLDPNNSKSMDPSHFESDIPVFVWQRLHSHWLARLGIKSGSTYYERQYRKISELFRQENSLFEVMLYFSEEI